MVVLKVLREFAGSTTLHGFGHLVSHKTSPKTKIVWTLSLIVAIMYASSEMRNSVISKYTIIFLEPWNRNQWLLSNTVFPHIKTGRLKRSLFQIEIFWLWKVQNFLNFFACILLDYVDHENTAETIHRNMVSNFCLQVGLRIPSNRKYWLSPLTRFSFQR